jgi:hypothetical protein
MSAGARALCSVGVRQVCQDGNDHAACVVRNLLASYGDLRSTAQHEYDGTFRKNVLLTSDHIGGSTQAAMFHR